MQIPNEKQFSGSMVLLQGTHYLSKEVIRHMAIYGRQLGYEPLPYSHAETLLWDPKRGGLLTSGARAKNSHAIPINQFYTPDDNILLLPPVIPLTDQEIATQWQFYETIKDNPYQKGNFLAWITFIKLRIAIIGKGETRLYCYEEAARYAQQVKRWHLARSVDWASVYDLAFNPSYYWYESD